MSSSTRNRNNYIEHELTDDEDSGSDGYVDDFRSLRGRRESSARSTASRRSRKNSTQSSLDDGAEEDEAAAHFNRSNGNRSSLRSNRDRRSGSIARSVQSGWAPASAATSISRSKELVVTQDRRPSTANKKLPSSSSFTDPSVMTPDSESSEAGTKAMVQAKIREKLAKQQQSSLDESSSDFWRPKDVATDQNRTQNEVNRRLTDQLPPPPPPPLPPISTVEQPAAVRTVEPVEPEILQLIDQDISTISLNDIPDDLPAGPAPSAPEFEWECEFCTFVNEPNTKICTICCKTPITAPAKKTNGVAVEPAKKLIVETNKSAASTGTVSSSEDNKDSSAIKKGKTRKISFWPGTKSK